MTTASPIDPIAPIDRLWRVAGRSSQSLARAELGLRFGADSLEVLHNAWFRGADTDWLLEGMQFRQVPHMVV